MALREEPLSAGQYHLKIAKIIGITLLSFVATLWLVPFIIVIFTAVKSQSNLYSRGVFALPTGIEFKNFIDAWQMGRFSIFYRNSLIISFLKVPIGIFVASLAAFPLAKFDFRFRDSILIFFLLGLGIPIHITLLPVSIILHKMHILNTLIGLFFPYIACGLPFQILVCRGFFRTIPFELIEAAHIDGCSDWRVYFQILLPLAKPALSALFIMDFLSTWNELLMALIYIHTEQWKTVPLGILYFQGQFSSSYPIICAGVLLSIIPVMLVYIFLQRYFVSGVTSGAVKG
jgi:raffinose/stachyose/melibiose transport system permease protein